MTAVVYLRRLVCSKMSALIRRYGCLYTSEAHKHPRNRRQHDGYVTIHHYNASAVLWSETDRQLKWTLLSRSDLKRKTCELQASGISEAYRLADDEEVVFGGGWVARVSGECVHESQQVRWQTCYRCCCC